MEDHKLADQYLKLYLSVSERFEKHEREAQYRFIMWAVKKYSSSNGKRLLDVACGEGKLDNLLKSRYSVTGLDVDKKVILKARKKVKGVRLVLGDMKDFTLGENFDVITCVHGIDHGYLLRKNLRKTLINIDRHTKVGGVIIFDLNFLKELWKQSSTITNMLSKGKKRYTRVFHRKVKGNIGISYSVTIAFDGDKRYSETSLVHKSTDLLNLKQVKTLSNSLGFDILLFDGWRKRLLEKVRKDAPVCVLVKR